MRRRPGTVGISAAIRRKYDVEVVPHLICGGWSKYDVEDSLIDMDFLGLHNVLALRGDKRQNEPPLRPLRPGTRPRRRPGAPDPGHEPGRIYRRRSRGVPPPKFSVGVAGYPEKHFEAANPQSDLQYLKEKGRCRRRLHRDADVLRQQQVLRFRGALPQSGHHGTDHPGHQADLDAQAPGDPAPHLQRQPARRAW